MILMVQASHRPCPGSAQEPRRERSADEMFMASEWSVALREIAMETAAHTEQATRARQRVSEARITGSQDGMSPRLPGDPLPRR
ncbi:hypothetical protein AAFF_G00212620 [Aldrovandia affinis]|uniref:Uncharacterized protein n=1 Tax=Aldrovandia affinis TaxID=143900 RepID=A0AAD7RH05_9TELE|nr:hypothetical protein AAFF_G00212620 [Aldrovandia affinis]